MELRCQLERHTAALYADRAPVITNRRADAVLSFYLARARKPLFHHPPTLFEKGKFGKFWEEISGIRQRCMRENSRKIWDEAHSIPHRYARMTLKQKNLNTLWSIFACVVFFISLFHICKIFLLIFFYLQINTRFIIFLEMEINRETNGEIGITITGAARSIR